MIQSNNWRGCTYPRTWNKDGHPFNETLLVNAIVDALEYNDGNHLAFGQDFYELPEEDSSYDSKPIHTIADGAYVGEIAFNLAKLIFDHDSWLKISNTHVNNGFKEITANSVDHSRKYAGNGRASVWVLKNGK